MHKKQRMIALALIALASASLSAAEVDSQRVLYTPGYFLDQVQFDGDTHRYYHDYALEVEYFHVTPSISPYDATGAAVLGWTNFNSRTYTVKDAGRYVEAWNFYTHGSHSSGSTYNNLRGSITDCPKSCTVTYSFLAGLSNKPTEVDVIPFLKMMDFTLAYDANGGTFAQPPPETVTYVWSNEVTTASASCVSRVGYSFTGWNTATNGTGRAVEPDLVLEPSGGSWFGLEDNHTNVTLYAQWKANKYPLQLKLGTGIERIYYRRDADGTSASTVDADYSPRQNEDGSVLAGRGEDTASTVDADYSPRQNEDGSVLAGRGEDTASTWESTTSNLTVLVDYATTWYAYAVAQPGYTYTDYSAEKPASGSMGLNGASYSPNAKANGIVVEYDGNGSTSGSTSSSTFDRDREGLLAKNGYTRAYTVTFNVNGSGASVDPSSVVSTYGFTGWNSAADGTGLAFAEQQAVTNICGSTGEVVRLYAQWQPSSVVLSHPTRTGSSFLGWYADKGGRYKVGNAGDDYVPTKSVTLYAKWSTDATTLRFTYGAGIARIYYRLDGATAWTPVRGDTDVSVANGTTWEAYAVPAAGYTYTTTTKDRPASGTVSAAGATFAPIASAKSVTITYDGNGKTGGWTPSSRIDYDASAPLSDNAFERVYRVSFNVNGSGASVNPTVMEASSTFTGWNTEPDGSGTAYANQQSVTNLAQAASRTLYAQWVLGAVILPEPTWEGHTFLGWSPTVTPSTTTSSPLIYSAGSSYTPTANATLYAIWDTLDYTLSLIPGKGIERIYYRTDADGTSASTVDADYSPRQWDSTTTSTNITLAFGAKWYAYAVAKPGYAHTATTAERPASGTMSVAGATFAPEGTPNTITVSYNGQYATSGAMSPSRFTYDTPGLLDDNAYGRSHTVTFNANGSGATVTPSALVGRYDFLCWNTRADGSGVSYANQQEVLNLSTGGVFRLYAQWTNITATVTLPTPSREGYTFRGWYAEPECLTKIGDAGDAYLPTADVTFYAKWEIKTYTVTFRDGYQTTVGAQGTLIKIEAVPYGGSATAPTPPAHASYRFTGWSVDAASCRVTSDLTTYAQYEPISYHVTYHSNYGSGTEQSVLSAGCGVGEASDTLKILDVNELGTSSEKVKFQKPGYRFLGWSWSADAATNDWSAGASMAHNVIAEHIGASDTADLYAIWEPITYQVVYAPGFELEYPEDYNGGPTNQTLTYDQPVRLLANPYTLDHQRFLGWKKTTNLSPTPNSNFDYTDQALVTNLTQTANDIIYLTAVWDGNGDHTVVFVDESPVDADYSPRHQTFYGTNSQYLASNTFPRIGYTFDHWSNSVDAASCRVLTNRASYAFSYDSPRHSTNIFYAVWEPITYTIIFNAGTNGVQGTITQIVDCVYGEPISVPASGYTNYCSGGFWGWRSADGKVIFHDEDIRQLPVVSNLTPVANSCVTLYADWDGVGDLSLAVGLTNAALVAEDLARGRKDDPLWVTNRISGTNCIAALTGIRVPSGYGDLHMTVSGAGWLSFSYMNKPAGDETPNVNLLIDWITNETEIVKTEKWASIDRIRIEGDGSHDVRWRVECSASAIKTLALTGISWTPDDPAPNDGRSYELKYIDTRGFDVSDLTRWPTNYIFSEGATYLNLTDAAGNPYWYVDSNGTTNTFDHWEPRKIDKFTTGDITVRAMWTEAKPQVTVTWELGDGLWRLGGEAGCLAHVGDDVTPPVKDVDFYENPGCRFTGWYLGERLVSGVNGALVDAASCRVTSDVTFRAKAELITNRIEYANIPVGVVNTNAVGFTIEDETTIGPLADTREKTFDGWNDKFGALGDRALPTFTFTIPTNTTCDVTLEANWTNRVWHTVTFDLGAHLTRTGGVALVQTVADGESATCPGVRVDEGYVFNGWRDAAGQTPTDCIRVDTTFTADVTVCTNELVVLGGITNFCTYGAQVSCETQRYVRVGSALRICRGWIGSGCVPGSGTSNRASFTVTGSGELTWNFETVETGCDVLVYYDGNGATDGWTEPSYFSYGAAGSIRKNDFTRQYSVRYMVDDGLTEWKQDAASYLFSCWNTETNGTGVVYDAGASVTFREGTQDFTLYAQWTTNDESIVRLPAPAARTGYTFAGWTEVAGGGIIEAALPAGTPYVPVSNTTFYAQWTANEYPLQLKLGTGIEKIYYRIDADGTSASTVDADYSPRQNEDGSVLAGRGEDTASTVDAASCRVTDWRSTTTNLTVAVAFGTTWQAYAVAKPGYTYTATSAEAPASGTMKIEGVVFDPSASANAIPVRYDGNGSTDGSTDGSTMTYDVPGTIASNGFARSYKVSFNANYAGGSVSPASTNAAYVFMGWATNLVDAVARRVTYADGQSVSNLSTGEVVTLYAVWTTNDASVVALPEPTRTGYTFAGWSDAAGCRVYEAGESFVPASNTTFYAQWTANEYPLALTIGKGIERIYYSVAGRGEDAASTVDAASCRVTDWRSTTTNLTVAVAFGTTWQAYAVAKPGYTYTATSAEAPASGTMTEKGAVFEPSATANAIPVRYNGTGATGGTTDGSTMTYDVPGTIASNGYVRAYTVTFSANYSGGVSPAPAVSDYAFAGWATNAVDAASCRVTYGAGQTVTNLSTGAAVPLYAVWMTNDASVVTLPLPTRTGYSFAGWSDAAGCRVYEAGESFVPASNTTFYAQWRANEYPLALTIGKGIERIYYRIDADGTSASTVDADYSPRQNEDGSALAGRGEDAASTVDADYSPRQNEDGSALAGRGEDTASTVDADYSPRQNEDGSVLAGRGEDTASTWESTTASTSVPVTFGTTWQAYAVAKPGYSYSATTAEAPTSGTMTEKGATFAPSATANAIPVRYDGNGATDGSTDGSTMTYDVPGTIASNGYVRAYTVTFSANYSGGVSPAPAVSDYAFAGWATNAVDAASCRVTYTEGQSVSNLSSGAAVTLYAVWTTNDASVVTLPLPTRTGYTFAGWSDAAGCRVYEAGSQFVPASNTTFYAQWRANEYPLALTIGKGIERIYYRIDADGTSASIVDADYSPRQNEDGSALAGRGEDAASTWESTTTNLTVLVTYGTTWQAYAVAKMGYKYTATSIERPKSGTMTEAGAVFAPKVEAANEYVVTYNGSGSTSGAMDDTTMVYGLATNLQASAYVRSYNVAFNAAGGTVDPVSTNAAYAFAGWATNLVDAASCRVTYADGQSVSNLSSGAAVTLYAVWTTNDASVVTLPLPMRTGYGFEGWRDAAGCRVYGAGESFVPTNDTTLVATWGPMRFPLALTIGKGIERIYYRIDADGTSASTVDADYSPRQNEDGSVLAGRGEDAASTVDAASCRVTDWRSTTTNLTVLVTFGANWSAYAIAKPGYTYAATSAEAPASGSMTEKGSAFAPSATANAIPVRYDGNGATGGAMSGSTLTYDTAGSLATNCFACSYTVAFDAAGGAVSPAVTNAAYAFAGWATNTVDAASCRVTYADGQSVSNLSSGAAVTLYAVWTTNDASVVTLPLPMRTGYGFEGWRDAAGCRVYGAGESFVPTNDTTLTAQWGPMRFPLALTIGKGIERIYYRMDADGTSASTVDADYSPRQNEDGSVHAGRGEDTASTWESTTASTNVLVTFGTTWQAYAVAKPGYTYAATSAESPSFGTMTEKGATFAPSATANAIPVAYNGNGATGGSVAGSTMTYDTPDKLATNAYARSFAVAFNAAGGTVDPVSTNVSYAFAGWATNLVDAASCRVTYADGQSVSNLSSGAAVTLYAVWTTNDASVVTLPLPTRTGYGFEGWRDAAGCRVYGAGESFVPTNNTTLVAEWKIKSCDLTLKLGKGISEINYQTGMKSASWNPLTTDTVIPLDYNTTWYAWAKAKTGYTYGPYNSGNSYIAGQMTEQGATFEPVATANTVPVAYNGNGATSGSMDGSSFTYDEPGNLASNAFVRSYTVTFNANYDGGGSVSTNATYVFAGWSVDAASCRVTYADGQSVLNLTADSSLTTLYAVWATNDASVVTVPDMARTGYTFNGWTDAAGKSHSPGETLLPTADTVLTAQWTVETYKLILDHPGKGIGKIYYSKGDTNEWDYVTSWAEVTVPYGVTWYAYAEAEEGYKYTATSKERPKSSVMTEKGAVFSPVVESANTYVVMYDGNGKTSGSMDDTTMTFGSAMNLSHNGYVRSYRVAFDAAGGTVDPVSTNAAYTFAGWATNAVDAASCRVTYADGQSVSNLSTGAGVTLYAVWTTTDASVVTLPLPTKTGYTFTGWTDAASGGLIESALPAGTRYVPTSDTTLTATWEIQTYALQLRLGTGIDHIGYQYGTNGWSDTFANLDIPIPFGTAWQAYAVAKAGYTYNETDSQHPQAGTIAQDGNLFWPSAAANEIRIVYSGNGANAGSMPEMALPYGSVTNLPANAFSRAYTVTFDANREGVTIDPAETNVAWTFTGWNTKADGSGLVLTDGQSVSNLTIGGTVTLYAQWSDATARITLPTEDRVDARLVRWEDGAAGRRFYEAGAVFVPTADTTLVAQWEEKSYPLALTIGKGIERIYYRMDADGTSASTVDADYSPRQNEDGSVLAGRGEDTASTWESTSTNLTVSVTYGATWQAYAVAKAGYTYTATSAEAPASGTMTEDGAAFAPSATANKISVCYDGNGATGGEMSGSTLTYDTPGNLTSNGYLRAYLVQFDAAGGTVDPIATNVASAFLGWNTKADGSGEGYANGATVTNLSTGAGVTLYAQWEEGTVIFPEPKQDGYLFAGWTDATRCRVYMAGEAFTPTSNTTFQAQWTATGLRYVAFDGREATGGKMSVQTFAGTGAQPLTSNAYVRTGHAFAGWAVSAVDAASCRVTYADGANFNPSGIEIGATSTLYAVWSPITYWIDFQKGAEDVLGSVPSVEAFYGARTDLPNCAQGGFTNLMSQGFLGWALEQDGAIIATNASATAPCVLTTNLTTVAGARVNLSAVWQKGVGELSEAVGLTNAVLRATADEVRGVSWQKHEQEGTKKRDWDYGHPTYIRLLAGDATIDSLSPLKLAMQVEGPGEVAFQLYYNWGGELQYKPTVSVVAVRQREDGSEYTIPLFTYHQQGTLTWQEETCRIDEAGVYEVRWLVDGTLKPWGSTSRIALDKIRWTPDPVVASAPKFALMRLASVVAPKLALVDADYSPRQDAIGTIASTGDAVETSASTGDAVGTSASTGDAVETSASTGDDVLILDGVTNYYVSVTADEGGSVSVLDPAGGVLDETEFYAPTGCVLTAVAQANVGWRFAGWYVDADYSPRQDAVGTSASTGDAVETSASTGDAVETSASTGDAVETSASTEREHAFMVDGPIALKAVFARVFTVTFDLGDHLVQTGDVELVQSVVSNGVATVPGFIVDEGCTFNGWRLVDADYSPRQDAVETSASTGDAVGTSASTGDAVETSASTGDAASHRVTGDTVFVADVTVGEHTLALGTNDVTAAYGESVTATAPFDVMTANGTNLVCIGWTGSGSVPSSGTATQTTFTVTGEGTLSWLYETNYWVSVTVDAADKVGGAGEAMGSVAVLDPAGGVMATNEFWAPVGAELTAVAQVKKGYRFVGWTVDADYSPRQDAVGTSASMAFTVSGPISLTAVFEDPTQPEPEPEPEPEPPAPVVTNTVTFKLDEQLFWAGGGALVQSVTNGATATEPEVVAASGYEFAGWYDRNGVLVDVESIRITCSTNFYGKADEQYTTTPYLSVDVADGCEGMGTVSGGDKIVKAGKRASVRATAAKGYVFAGWYEGGELVSEKASYSFTMPTHDVSLVAKFLSKGAEASSVRVSVNGIPLFAGREGDWPLPLEPVTNVTVGVYLEWPLVTTAEVGINKVAVTGLPSGLKFTAKEIYNRTTGTRVPANTIYGIPTAGGKTKTMKVTVTTAGKNKVVGTMDIAVAALPTWLVGTYTGGSVDADYSPRQDAVGTSASTGDAVGTSASTGDAVGTSASTGSASVTVAKTGKISGKWISEGLTWKLTASGFDRVDADYSPRQDAIGTIASTKFTATVTAKCSQLVETMTLIFTVNDLGYGTVDAIVPIASDAGETSASTLFSATYVPWKTDAKLKALAAELKGEAFDVDAIVPIASTGNDPSSFSGHVTLVGKVGANGTVSVKGAFTDAAASTRPYTATAKSTLVPLDPVDADCSPRQNQNESPSSASGGDALRFELFLYYPYKKNKFEGYATRLILRWDGDELVAE